MDDLDRQLWEIDENLMRAELGPAEMAEHTAKRAEVVRQKVVFANLAKPESDPSQNADKGQGEFVEDTAKKTGQSKRTVERDKARGEAIPADVLGKIQGTELDKGPGPAQPPTAPPRHQNGALALDGACAGVDREGTRHKFRALLASILHGKEED